MRNYLLGLASGLVAAFIVLPAAALVLWLASDDEPSIRADSALVVNLDGGAPEHVDSELPALLGGSDGAEAVTLYALAESIRKAGGDDDIRALVLRGSGSGLGWGTAQEIRWAIQEFQQSGKPVWAFLEVASRSGYYVASLADRVAIQPEGLLDLKGLRLEALFFKGTLDKLGVAAEVVRAGKYKSAGEPFVREDLSQEAREALDEMLDEFYGQLLNGLAEGRGGDAAHWRGVLDHGPFTASEAESHGLVDSVLYQDSFFAALDEAVEVDELHRVDSGTYAKRALGGQTGEAKIALMHAGGAIASGSSWTDPMTGIQNVLGSRTFIRQIDRFRDDESIDGVILRIDSPGGDAIASEQMLRAVRRLREEKPVVVSMANVAASGGYYIASAPDVPIVAYPGTYTGSIGVFYLHLNLRGLYEKLGLNKEILARGRFAAIDSDYKAPSREERERLRDYIDAFYATFLKRVSEGRAMEPEAVHEIAQGRVWIGAQAHENGLVDALGGYGRAIELVKEAAEIETDAPVRIVTYPPRRSVIDVLLERGASARVPRLLEPPALGELQQAWKHALGARAFLRGGPMHLMPYALSVD